MHPDGPTRQERGELQAADVQPPRTDGLAEPAGAAPVVARNRDSLPTIHLSEIFVPECGATFGHYRIVREIGSGGMGVVFEAIDTHLGRPVAIKILRPERIADPESKDRLFREARSASALNHPNIVTVFEAGEERGCVYIVMEFITGKTLHEHLGGGKANFTASLRFAIQITDALAAAQEAGIVHRDLKPANIMVTEKGTIKLVDFGLAKSTNPVPIAGGSKDAGFQTAHGSIVGTCAYMTPEQIEGKPVNHRSDIFSLGSILYEMLTGRLAFDRDSLGSVLSAVLHSDPVPLRELAPGLPAGIERAVSRCHRKAPEERWQHALDLKHELEDLLQADGAEQHAAPAENGSPRAPNTGGLRRLLPGALTAVLGGVALWSWLHVPTVAPRLITRWSTMLADTWSTMSTGTGPYPGVALSPDGTRLVYGVGLSGAQTHLTLRMLDRKEGQVVPGTAGAFQPAFSPDGQWLVFGVQNQLKKIPVIGGTAITLYKGSSAYGASWGLHDTIVFGSGVSKGLMRVPAAGGKPETLTTPDSKNGEKMHAWPQFIPGGKSVLFTICTDDCYDKARVAVLDLKSGAWHVLLTGASSGRYVPTGHLVYAREGALFAVRFDAKRLAVTGPEAAVIEGVSSLPAVGFADYAFADSGLLVYVAGGQQPFAETLEWADRKGARQPFNLPARNYAGLRFSPDGGRVAFVINSPDLEKSDIWIYELARGSFMRLTSEGSSSRPVWTPDGLQIAYRSTQAGKNGIYRVATDGSGKPELLLATESVANPNCWTPDGKALLYSQVNPARNIDIWILPAPESGGEAQPRVFLRTAFNEQNAQVSPDGKWVAYQSDESGQTHVYVLPFTGPGGKVQVSTQPRTGVWRWSGNGRELFYREAGEQLWVVDVQSGTSFRAGQPRALFKHVGNFDIAPGGQRFLLVKSQQPPSGGAQLEVVTDWFEDLRRRAPPR